MKRVIISIIGAVIFIQSFAQQVNTELKTLINQSFTYFPRFKELDQAVKINEQRVELASLGNKPNVAGNFDYNYVWPVPSIDFPTGNNGETKKFEFQPNHNINTFVSLSTPIYDFGKTKANVDKAKEDLQQSRNTIEYNKAQLAAQVSSIYFTINYLQKAISLEDSVISVLEANKKFEEDRYKNGDALKVDVLTWVNNIDIEQNRKVDLQNNLQKQFNLLAYATGQTESILSKGQLDFVIAAASVEDALKTA